MRQFFVNFLSESDTCIPYLSCILSLIYISYKHLIVIILIERYFFYSPIAWTIIQIVNENFKNRKIKQ